MTLRSHSSLITAHLETLTESVFSKDTGRHGCRLELTLPTPFQWQTPSESPTARAPFEISEPVVFLDKVLGRLLFCFETKPSDALRTSARDVAAQIACLFACPDLLAAVELDQAVEQQSRAHPDFDWYGVYRLDGADLLLTSFRGAASPHIRIPTDSGICGAAVRENDTLNIPDVKADPRYLSCSISTRSELVVPIRNEQGQAIAEIDIDSHKNAAFDAALVKVVEGFAVRLAPMVLKLEQARN